jgi:DME family drug/metabolite transporter
VRWNVAVAALAASWGFISIIVAGVDLDATVLVFFRLALAALTIALILAVAPRRELLDPGPLRRRVALAGCVLGAHWFLFFETIKLSSVAVAVLTVYTAPVFLALLAPLFLPEPRSRAALLALVPAAAGMALIALAGESGTHARPLAIACGLGAAVTYAALVIVVKQLTAVLDPRTVTVWTYGTAAVALSPFLFTADRVLPHGAEIAYVLLLGVVFTALSGLIYVWLLRRVTAQAVGILAFLEPVSAALLAAAILDQPLGGAILVGGALVLAAGLLVVVYEPGDAAAVEAPVRPSAVRGRRRTQKGATAATSPPERSS